jgi:pilus assembly protein CpaC
MIGFETRKRWGMKTQANLRISAVAAVRSAATLLALVVSVAAALTVVTPRIAFAQSKVPPALDENLPVDAKEQVDLEASSVDPKRHKTILLYLGIEQQETLPYLPVGAVFKGDYKKVVKVSIDKENKTLKFQPVRAGDATFTIYDSKDKKVYDFTLEVGKNTLAKDAQEIRTLLSDIEGITIKIINNRVVVDGQVLLPKEINRIMSVLAQYGEAHASSLVTLSPLAQRKIAQAIANDVNNPEITVRPVNEKFILEGSVSDVAEKDRAQAIAEMYVPDLVKEFAEKTGEIVKLKRTFVLNLISVKAAGPKDPGKIIQLVVHFVELNKNYQRSFKFQFTPTLEDNSAVSFTNDSRAPGGIVSQLTGVVSNLLPKLNWAKQAGHARVLQSSSLIVLDGEKGELKNITKIPYQTVSGTGQPSTSFEEAGMVTTITPKIINPRSDSINLKLDFSMKSLLGLTDKGPMISQSSMQTVIVVRSGQSAAVGGLISNSTGTDYNKLPKNVTSDPIISLYASKSFQRNQSQFVVFVTPIIKASASQGAEKVKEKFRLKD